MHTHAQYPNICYSKYKKLKGLKTSCIYIPVVQGALPLSCRTCLLLLLQTDIVNRPVVATQLRCGCNPCKEVLPLSCMTCLLLLQTDTVNVSVVATHAIETYLNATHGTRGFCPCLLLLQTDIVNQPVLATQLIHLCNVRCKLMDFVLLHYDVYT